MPLIDLTDTELVHIMDSLRLRVADLRESPFGPELDDLANELEEIEHDLFEAFSRQDDGWRNLRWERTGADWPAPSAQDIHDACSCAHGCAEAEFIQAGMDGREQLRSMAHARRHQLLKNDD